MIHLQTTNFSFTQRELQNIMKESCQLNGGINDNAIICIEITNGDINISHPRAKATDAECKQTSNCIICGVKAKYWSGHVLKSNEKITAGVCEQHKYCHADINIMRGPGCYGEWKEADGIEKC